jgi:hypothetical protein
MFTAVLMVAALLTLAGGLYLVLSKDHPQARLARTRRRPESVPPWLWERMLKLDVAFNEVTVVQLIGRPGDGKSVLLAVLTEYLSGRTDEDLRDRVRLIEASAGLSKVLKDLKKGKWSAKTAPADPGRPEEYLIVKVGDRLVAVVSQPGDILRDNETTNPIAARQLFGVDDQLGVVFNAFRYDQVIATKALLGVIATLQAPPLNYDVAPATLIACDLLFGMGEAAVKEQELDWEEISKFTGAKVVWEPATAGNDGKFSVRLAADGDPTPLMRAIKNLALFAVRQDLDVINMRQLIRQCPGILVVLTRLDLLPLIPALGEADFARIFDDAFGPATDYWASQRVQARNVRLVIRPDAKRPVRIADLDTTGGKNLWTSITRMLGRQRAAVQPLGKRVAGAAVMTLPALGTVIAFAALSWLFVGSEIQFVWTWAAWAAWVVLAWGTLTGLRAIRWSVPKSAITPKLPKQPAGLPKAPVPSTAGEMSGAVVNRIAAQNGAPVS